MQKISAYLAELIGTYALVLFGPMSVTIFASILEFNSASLFSIGITFGMIVMIMIYSIGQVSGCHINPAVTISLLALRKIKINDAIAYIVCQLIGAALAGLTHRAILPEAGAKVNYGLTLPGAAIGGNEAIAFLVEAILTFFLLFTIMGTALHPKATPGWAGFAIGMIVAVDIWVGGPLTGASMNPARTFGPAIASGVWRAHWVYWAGPIIGGLIAAFLYQYAFIKEQK